MVRAIPWVIPFLVLFLVSCRVEKESEPLDRVLTLLQQHMKSSEVESRRTAALSLGKIGDDRAVGALLAGLQDPDPLVKEYSAWALGGMGEKAAAVASGSLLELLRDPSERVKRAASLALVELGGSGVGKQVTAKWSSLLQSKDASTRRGTALAIAGFETSRTFSELAPLLKDPNPAVRQGALSALGELGRAQAIPLFVDRLRRDQDSGVRGEAAFRLGKLGGKEEISLLTRVATDDPSLTVRRWARWALEMVTFPDGSG